MKTLTIATRQSPLALWQARWVRQALQTLHADLNVELLGLTTKADQMLSISLAKVGGKGLFVKELEEALLDGRADIAVHSMKDVPMFFPEGLCLPVICQREDPRDAWVSNRYSSVADLPAGAVVGTSSPRRQSQFAALRPDVLVKALRGNVNTRLAKLDNDEYAGIILAAAGLIRLDLKDRIKAYLAVEDFLPAAGQGVLGIECREDDQDVRELIAPLTHLPSALCVIAERALCRRIGGGCQLPVAAFAQMAEDQIFLRGLVGKLDGSLIITANSTDHQSHADALGIKVAEELIAAGADLILKGQDEC